MKQLVIDPPNEKQKLFFAAKARYIAYGGARAGGKSWAMRIKFSLLCLHYDGIQILLLRRTLPELRENHVLPLRTLLKGIAVYNEQKKVFVFPNGARLVLGYCAHETDVLQYQGQAYDVIGMEEATMFTEFQFNCLRESNRSSGLMKEPFAPRMYLTMNPGGVGHHWVKRLFVDRRIGPEGRDRLPAIYEDGHLAAVWRLGVDVKFLPEGEPCRFIQIIKETEEKKHGQ